MSKKQFKSQASSGRAGITFGFPSSGFGSAQSSILSHIQEPPDYSTFSDPNIIVAVKNLSKKDGTTKAKALEDLQAYITSSQSEIEEAVLEAWVRLFPRLSIDSTRRVRQLAHIVNGQLCSKCGKRVVRHMPRLAGPWLAGACDTDRMVARAAGDALHLVFPTTEKVHGVRRTFRRAILEYCRDASMHETVQTLSDERTVSSDDAKATYARVVGTSLSIMTSLMRELHPQDELKDLQIYKEVFGDPKLWDFVHASDGGVRRSTHRLVRAGLELHSQMIHNNIHAVSNGYIYKGLPSDQTGSALDFIQTLAALTAAFPGIWTNAYSGKKSAISRLQHFLKRGSQSATPEYWDYLGKMLLGFPEHVLPTTAEGITDLLSAARDGVSRKEDRFNASAAWTAYFMLVNLFTPSLADVDAEGILDRSVMPVVRQYLDPVPETAEWNIVGPKPALIVSRVLSIERMVHMVSKEWPRFADKLIETAKLSQPEQSKDFDRSQKHVAAAGERWAALQGELYEHTTDLHSELSDTLNATSLQVLNESVTVLKSRNGKPYGTAAVLEHLLRTCSKRLLQHKSFRQNYLLFARNDMSTLVTSASLRHLIQGLYTVKSESEFPAVMTAVLIGLLGSDESLGAKLNALRIIFTSSTPTEAIAVAKEMPELQAFIVNSFSDLTAHDFADTFIDLIQTGAITTDAVDKILAVLTESLSISDRSASALSALNALSRTDESAVKMFMSREGGAGEQLLPSLVRLEQSVDDELAENATSLSSKLSSSVNGTDPDNKYSVILRNLETASKRSLPIDALHDLTLRLVGPERKIQNASGILPALEEWQSALHAVMRAPRPSLAILSPLSGAMSFVQSDGAVSYTRITYDGEGFSPALRMSMYVARLLVETNLSEHLDDAKATVFALLHLSVLVTEDSISKHGANRIWRVESGLDSETAVLNFVSEAHGILSHYWKTVLPDLVQDSATQYSQLCSILESLRQRQANGSPLEYYLALVDSEMHANLFELHGYSNEQAKRSEDLLKQYRSAKRPLLVVALVAGFRQPLSGTQTLNRVCNDLVTALTELDYVENKRQGLADLVLFNTILQTQEDIVAAVAKQRLVFLVKHLLLWLGSETELVISAEVCKTLSALLPGMHDMYGEHWEHTVAFLISCWNAQTGGDEETAIDEGQVNLTFASLKLFGVLRKMSQSQEPNDDLVDALNNKADQIHGSLIHVLMAAAGVNDETNQPLMITHDILGREIASLPYKKIGDLAQFYPLLYTPSRGVQQAAFDLLHLQIPFAQEQISFDAALENKTAQLPDELLSLIIEAPTLESLADASFDRVMPLSLQSFLYSWRLLFDHFNGSSFRVKSDYIEQLKDGTYLSGLLDFTFDFLGHARGRPIDVSKFDVEDYAQGTEPSPERDVQWLLTHLYYLALMHLPSSVKSYYLDIRSRQTSLAVQNWTAKHLSPRIITTALHSVAEWSKKGDTDDADSGKMTVKVGMKSKEIYVSYVVDEQTMAIKVVLPDAYPLASAQVVGVSRVAVKEEKWQSWLRNCQGVITFSNGSITDGLTAWRKNVTGALKGQTECAICYSIISADKQLPTKRCPTCKNLFHSSCLWKWFKTSNASTCPLCRNPFNFN